MSSANDVAEAVRQRLLQIEEEAEKLRQYLKLHEEFAALGFGPEIAGSPPAQTVDESESKDAAPKRTRVTDNPKPAVVIRKAIQLLRQKGHPMTRRELHEALAAEGVVVKGVDPIKALGTMLWRGKDELVQLDGYGYWPRVNDYPPAGYVGDASDLFPLP